MPNDLQSMTWEEIGIEWARRRIRELEAELAEVKDELSVTRKRLDAMIDMEDKDHILEFAPILGLWRIVCKVRERNKE